MNYLSICQELEEVNNCIEIYKSKIERKKSRAEKLEEYKKLWKMVLNQFTLNHKSL